MLTHSTVWRPELPEVPLPVRVFSSLAHLEEMYPGFGQWYWTKVASGLRDGSRRIFVEGNNEITGVVIAKRSRAERKLCTVWIAPQFAGQGLGTRLMRNAMSWLGTTRPLITVPEERLAEFQPSFTRWRFSLHQVADSLYRPGHLEYIYNGPMIPR